MNLNERESSCINNEVANKKTKKNKYWWLVLVLVIVGGIVVYNLPYFKEKRLYDEVVKERSVYKCNEYYEEYPSGRFYEDVMMLEVELTSTPLHLVTRYLKEFPNGKHVEKMREMYDGMWAVEFDKYENRDKTSESPEAVKFMTEMLHHMKDNMVNTVYLKVNPIISLKDYTEYDEKIRMLLELFYTNEKLPLKKENIVSLKDNFPKENRDALVDILSEGVKKSFSRMFAPEFVTVVTDVSEADKKSPVITFDYTIKNRNEETDVEIPEIWTYTSNNVPTSYILAIDVLFDAKFTIPGTSVTYSYSEVGEPGNEIKCIENINDGYKQMTAVCFAKFSDKMSENLGLDEVYSVEIDSIVVE